MRILKTKFPNSLNHTFALELYKSLVLLAKIRFCMLHLIEENKKKINSMLAYRYKFCEIAEEILCNLTTIVKKWFYKINCV